MSLTEHEVGQVPSATPARPPFGGSALILSIIGIVLLSMMGSPVGLAIGIVLLFINGHRYRMVGIIGTALSGTILVTTIAYFAIMFGVVAHNGAAPVATAAPASTVSVPQQTTPTVVVPAPAPTVTPDTSGLAVQPLSSSASDLIAKVEAYRSQAFLTGDMKPLDNYYPSHQNVGWQHDYDEIVTGKTSGDISTITNIKLISVSNAKIVADVTIKDVGVVNGKTTTDVFIENNTYEVVNGRWYLTS